MLYYNEQKYKEYITENDIKKIEKKLGVQCLFGGAYSAYVYGIENALSDFDFYLVYKKGNQTEEMFRFFDNKKADILMVDWDYIQINSQAYLKTIQRYPSILYRSSMKENVVNVSRTDFTSQVLFEILYSDYIFDSGFLAENTEHILSGISYIGVLDYYYSRAFGNLTHFLSLETALTVKYLLAFLEYACMMWLLERKTVPQMDFITMAECYLPLRFRFFFDEVLSRQKNLITTQNIGIHANLDRAMEAKEKAVIGKNEDFNNWLRLELEKIAEQMGKITFDVSVTIQEGEASFWSLRERT